MVTGKRFDRYHELGQHAFGEKLGEVGANIVYTLSCILTNLFPLPGFWISSEDLCIVCSIIIMLKTNYSIEAECE
ncbi:hypothetical protein ACJIZ3_015136 [Penstemon smallii]|uniref:Uncharacterized protein n=1 Tax=Penstemon smallii TaxID=265156 RepID=A0ABD3RLU9_9LAMI